MIHAVVLTHTHQRLRQTLIGLASQTRPPDTITVTCDGDDPAITEFVHETAPLDGQEVAVVSRVHMGSPRLAQGRNNAVRHLLARFPDRIEGSAAVFLDGDCCPGPGLIASYEAAMDTGADLLPGFRINLSEEQSERFDESAVRLGLPPVELTGTQVRALVRRRRRYQRHLALRRLGLTKPHKPKIIGANFAVALPLFVRINGFDERYTGWGLEDDDLARRAYSVGARPAVCSLDAVVYHLHHPTRAPEQWADSAGALRFLARAPVWCESGLANPAPQPPPVVTIVSRRAVAV